MNLPSPVASRPYMKSYSLKPSVANVTQLLQTFHNHCNFSDKKWS
jgi:hypothetical protein